MADQAPFEPDFEVVVRPAEADRPDVN